MVTQTIGFNWGAAGVSTSVWRGVPLRHVLKRCGIYSRTRGALNVCFEAVWRGDCYYHYNRVLPSHVDAELATSQRYLPPPHTWHASINSTTTIFLCNTTD